MPNEPGHGQERAARITTLAMERAAAEFLRRLPEFQTRSEERIQRVSRELAKALAQAASLKGRAQGRNAGNTET